MENPHYDYADPHVYIKPAGQGKIELEANCEEDLISEKIGTLEDSQPISVPGNTREANTQQSQNQGNNLTGEYDHLPTQEVQAIDQCSRPAKPPRLVALVFEGIESNPFNWNIGHQHCPTNISQETILEDIYTVPDTTGIQAVNKTMEYLR